MMEPLNAPFPAFGADEVLMFRQVSGLVELFKHQEFSEAWELDDPDE